MGFDRSMPDGEIIRRLLRYARPYWRQFLLVFALMLISIVYDIVSPLIVGQIEGMVKERFALSSLFRMVAVYAGILLVSMIATYFQAILLQKTGQKILSALRMDLFRHIEPVARAAQQHPRRQARDPRHERHQRHFHDVHEHPCYDAQKLHGDCRRAGRDAAAQLCADADGAVLCAVSRTVYGDFPQVFRARRTAA